MATVYTADHSCITIRGWECTGTLLSWGHRLHVTGVSTHWTFFVMLRAAAVVCYSIWFALFKWKCLVLMSKRHVSLCCLSGKNWCWKCWAVDFTHLFASVGMCITTCPFGTKGPLAKTIPFTIAVVLKWPRLLHCTWFEAIKSHITSWHRSWDRGGVISDNYAKLAFNGDAVRWRRHLRTLFALDTTRWDPDPLLWEWAQYTAEVCSWGPAEVAMSEVFFIGLYLELDERSVWVF